MCVVLDPCHRGGGSTKREWERTIGKLPSLKESCAEVVKRVVSGESLVTVHKVTVQSPKLARVPVQRKQK